MKVVPCNISGWLDLAIALMQQIMQIAILIMIAVVLMPSLTTAKIAFAMKIWIAMVRLNWLEMATAMIRLIMQNAILMEVTVVDPVLIWSNALNVSVWMDHLQIIYVSYMIGRPHTFLTNRFEIHSPNLYRNICHTFDSWFDFLQKQTKWKLGQN